MSGSSGGFQPFPVLFTLPEGVRSAARADTRQNAATAKRFLFVKRHATSDATSGRTLFVCNVGSGDAAPDVEACFGRFGEVESVALSRAGRTRFARVVFHDTSAVSRVTSAASRLLGEAGDGGAKRATRSRKRVQEEGAVVAEHEDDFRSSRQGRDSLEALAAPPPRVELAAKVQRLLAEFDAAEANETRRIEESRKAVDDDGFTLVTYKKASNARDPAVVGAASASASASSKRGHAKRSRSKKKKPQELKNFYRNQIRESKREQLAELRERFEQDKQRVARLREQRKFKPF